MSFNEKIHEFQCRMTEHRNATEVRRRTAESNKLYLVYTQSRRMRMCACLSVAMVSD